MNLHDLEKLEYNKILEKLSLFCHTTVGKAFAMQLKPNSKKEQVETLLEETTQASNLILRKGNLPITEIADISISCKKLESNLALPPKALLEIASIFRLARELKSYFYQDENFETSGFSLLDTIFSALYTNIDIEKSIFSIILDENTIADNASSKLFSLRKDKQKCEVEIKESLHHILHSSNFSKAIMEPIVTMRNERYVIPIKEEFRGLIKGFIHDISSSGSTVFIEPMQVFELNNKIQSLKIEEHTEIEHILEKLSSSISPYLKELQSNVSLIGTLDFIFAKANFAKEIEAICPILNDKKQIDLKKARHPFIDKETVVPIDIKIGENYSSLIITGPNTGGKTVALKTTGLLCLMACSGLFIPAEEKSSIYVFDGVFADIGDEQSIQESLSTFSAHMTNIISIISKATSHSLILIDELGSGTDPVEGASLAISILEYFHTLGSITLTTTHYPEIKHYALVTDGFENASSAFDVEELKPTYQLLLGIPGKSNAFAISKKLGLPSSILNRAQSLLKQEDKNIEELLKNIYDDKLTIEQEKEEIEKNKNQIEILRKTLEQETMRQVETKQIQIEKAKLDAKNILLSAKEEANDTIKELNTLYENLKQLEDINFETWTDSEIANFVKRHFQKGNLKKANLLRKNLNSAAQQFTTLDHNVEHPKKEWKKENLKVGMHIKLKNFSELATITAFSKKANQLQVQIGNAKMNIKLDDIQEIVEKTNTKPSTLSSNKSSLSSLKSKQVTAELNVIGQTIEEACFVIDKYLDDCAMAKLSPIRIVHGKGTGKLREGVHTFLRKHPHVKSFRLGTFGEGEMGVTVVDLK